MDRNKFAEASHIDQLINGTEENIKTLQSYEVDLSFNFGNLKAHLRLIDNGFTEEELEEQYKKHIQLFLDVMVGRCVKVRANYEDKFEAV